MLEQSLCLSALSDNLSTPPVRLLWGALWVFMSAWGFGAALHRPLWKSSREVLEELVHGLVLISFFVFALNAIGWCQPQVAVGSLGIALCLLCLVRDRTQIIGRIQKPAPAVLVIFVLSTVLVGVNALFPSVSNDYFAIWGRKEKALSCEGLYQSHFITEPVWTPNHPE